MKGLISPQAKKLLWTGGVMLGMLTLVATMRVLQPGKPQAQNVSPDDIATQGFQQGKEAGIEEGIEEGQRAAMVPSIGDAQRTASVALSEAEQNAAALVESLQCSRKNAWREFAASQANEQRGQIAVLEQHLQTASLEPLKTMAIQTAHDGGMQASGEAFQSVLSPVIENAAIVAAISDIRAGISQPCAINPVPAITANNAYLLQSAMAASQRREAIKLFDEQLNEVAQEVPDESSPE